MAFEQTTAGVRFPRDCTWSSDDHPTHWQSNTDHIITRNTGPRTIVPVGDHQQPFIEQAAPLFGTLTTHIND